MGSPKSLDELRAIFEDGMTAVFNKVRQEKIRSGHPLVVSGGNGTVIELDPKTLEPFDDGQGPWSDKVLTDYESVRRTLWGRIAAGDAAGFRKLLAAHVGATRKSEAAKNLLAEEAGIDRGTLDELVDLGQDRDPALSTVAGLMKALAAD